jgi:uncharacterized YccA/Bax inhibitor family protein
MLHETHVVNVPEGGKMQTRNPVLSRIGQEPQATGGSGYAYQEGVSAYQQAQPGYAPAGYPPASPGRVAGGRLTVNDVIMKTAISFAVLLVGAAIGWQLTPSMPWLTFVTMFVAFGAAMVVSFRRKVSPGLVLAYAAIEGVFLGGISYTYNNWVQTVNPEYTGLIGQAVVGTLTAFAVMLVVYRSRIIKVNGTFMKVMMVALISYGVLALASFVAALFGVGGGWGFQGLGTLGLVIMGFAILLAAFTLMLDFKAIEDGVAMGLPENESWRMAFGLMVTLVWLYLEILRFLAILASSRD